MGKCIKFKERSLDCSQTTIMGILNVTPDSFSDGNSYASAADAVNCALQMLADGAAIIDIGGESTRPGAPEIPEEEEISRVVPVIRCLRHRAPDCVISIDTRKSAVAGAAVNAGADIINDVSGLCYSPDMAAVAAQTGAGLIIMHMRGTPADMQSPENLVYTDVTGEIAAFLESASNRAIAAGVPKEKIIWDPGIGFSKSPTQNLELINRIDRLIRYGYPILAGPSRKSFIGNLLNLPDPQQRAWGTGGAVAWLAMQGVELVRVHDVKPMKQLLHILNACKTGKGA